VTRATIALAAVLVTLSTAACLERPEEAPANAVSAPVGERTTLHLMTALPLLFPEIMRLDAELPAVTEALEKAFRLVPVDSPSELPEESTLLAIQPRALPADALVDLDEWVRRGGRIVLLADPVLEWKSERPLGDVLRPPMAFADTGLLGHWGLRLDAPEEVGPQLRGKGGAQAVYVSAGTLVASKRECRIEDGGVVARCTIGKGQAIVVADADWIEAEMVANAGGQPEAQFAQLIALVESLAPER
jgi:hypothetical protein